MNGLKYVPYRRWLPHLSPLSTNTSPSHLYVRGFGPNRGSGIFFFFFFFDQSGNKNKSRNSNLSEFALDNIGLQATTGVSG